MNKFYFLLIFLFTSISSESQTLLNILESDKIGFVTKRSIKNIIETYSENNEKTILSFSKTKQLLSRIPFESNLPVKFSIYWEYKDSLTNPKKRLDIKKSQYFNERIYYNYKYSNNILIEISQHDSNNNLISTIEIENDSLFNPKTLRIYDNKKRKIGEEKATYYYNDNIVKIIIYNKDSQIIGGVINPINPLKKTITLPEFIKKCNFDEHRSQSKNWNELSITFNLYTYKFHKKGHWIKKTHDYYLYSPSLDSITNIRSNGYVRREYKYY